MNTNPTIPQPQNDSIPFVFPCLNPACTNPDPSHGSEQSFKKQELKTMLEQHAVKLFCFYCSHERQATQDELVNLAKCLTLMR